MNLVTPDSGKGFTQVVKSSGWTDAITQDFRSWLRAKMNELPLEQQEMIKGEDWY